MFILLKLLLRFSASSTGLPVLLSIIHYSIIKGTLDITVLELSDIFIEVSGIFVMS